VNLVVLGNLPKFTSGRTAVAMYRNQIVSCLCYVLPSDSDCMKESSKWTAVMCGAVVC
jgi:hypothetical protein